MSAGTDLDGRVALVTGGAGAIGRAITERLIGAGAQVAVCGRDQPDELPDGAHFFAADVREAEAVDRLVAAVVGHHGRLDVVVNNAGGSAYADAATAPADVSTEIVTLNLLAPLFVSQAANRVMQAQDDGGAIVNLGSIRGAAPSPGTAAYGAAKAGLVDLTRSLSVEWAPKVRVNCVSAGLIALDPAGGQPDASDLALGRMGRAADVAEAVGYLASPVSAYVTGAELVVHGGGERPAYQAAVAGA